MHGLLNVSGNSKVKYFYGRAKEKRRLVSYVMGSDGVGDAYVMGLVPFTTPIPAGWTIQLKERRDNTHAKEDMFWVSPMGKTYRTVKALKKEIDKTKKKI